MADPISEFFSYMHALAYLLFGNILGPIIYLLIIILIAYFLDKKISRPLSNDKRKKWSISYNIDKYIFRRKNLDLNIKKMKMISSYLELLRK